MASYHGFPTDQFGNVIANSNFVANLDVSGTTQYQDLLKRVEELEERLLVLHPNHKLHEKYESLKEAYESYKIIERLVDENPKK